MSVQILEGDALAVLRTLPDESVHCCVTSPPYWGLRDYGIPGSAWGGEAGHKHRWGAEILVHATNHRDKRRWNHAFNGRGEEQPEEKRPDWKREIVGQGNFCACGAWRGALGLEPTPELYVAHIVEVFREVRRVLRDDGTLWLNLGDPYATGGGKVGDCPGGGKQGARYRGDHGADPKSAGIGPQTQPNRMPIAGLKPKDLVGIPWRVAFALQADGWYLRSDIILAKSARYYYDAAAIAEAAKFPEGSWGSTKKLDCPQYRSFYGEGRRWTGGASRNRRTVWTVSTKPFKGAHFATFPPKLIEPCILAGCPKGGVVLDPFAGSGTTGMVSRQHGRSFIGIELNPEYAAMARARIA